jgi:pimeloyl-ACP methyl ester carboxylesterase
VHFTAETSSNGVVERDFTVGEVPGVLWSPASGPAGAPLVLMGHSGGMSKRAPGILAQAHHYVTGYGFTVAAIDAPGHGDRPRNAEDEQWRATLDALQALSEIGTDAPVGYGGMTLGTATGLLLTAIEPRITAATFGGVFVYEALTEAAGQITIPIEFRLPWDDEEIDRQSGLALFDAFASKEKTLHANPGRHNQVPRFEIDNSARFFLRHLGQSSTAPA